MATTYQTLLHSTMLRANALVGSQVGALETTYLVTPLTATNSKSADFAFTPFRDAIIQAEEEFVLAVAFAENHPWRFSIEGVTSGLATGALLPSTSSTAKPIVGIPGAITDSVTAVALQEMPLPLITRRNRNANGRNLAPVYWYNITDAAGRIYHTAPNSVIIECCIYDRATQVTAYNANGNMLLPDPAESGIVARALSYTFRDGVFAEQAALWRQYSNDALTAIQRGMVAVPPQGIPVAKSRTEAAA